MTVATNRITFAQFAEECCLVEIAGLSGAEDVELFAAFRDMIGLYLEIAVVEMAINAGM